MIWTIIIWTWTRKTYEYIYIYSLQTYRHSARQIHPTERYTRSLYIYVVCPRQATRINLESLAVAAIKCHPDYPSRNTARAYMLCVPSQIYLHKTPRHVLDASRHNSKFRHASSPRYLHPFCSWSSFSVPFSRFVRGLPPPRLWFARWSNRERVSAIAVIR